MNPYFTRKNIIIACAIVAVLVGGFFAVLYAKSHKKEFALGSLAVFQKVSKLLPIEADTKAEIEAVNTLADRLAQKDDIVRTYMIMLQNNHELRPGGGFLGQYAVVKVKNGEIISTLVEDANLLDQRIKDANIKVTPPWPLQRYAQTKRWLLHDSNFSPDFPTNAEKAQYFYRIGGGREKFDGVIAINADVFNHLLELTGPITAPVETFTYANGTFAKSIENKTFTSENGTLMLEESVEKKFLINDDIEIPAEYKRNRKNVLKSLATEMISRLNHVGQIPKIAGFAQTELRDRDVMIWFKDPSLQSVVGSVHWDGAVAKGWANDYIMVVDANLGALKSDYWVKRSLEYSVDFTAGPKPVATVNYTYNHTATHGDWRTSDYHTYTRILAPKGSKYIDGSRVKTGGVLAQDSDEFDKTIFGYKVDAVMNQKLSTGIKYELPETIKADGYQLLIQKQSGIGNIPVTVRIKTDKGEFTQTATLAKDLKLSFQEVEEKK